MGGPEQAAPGGRASSAAEIKGWTLTLSLIVQGTGRCEGGGEAMSALLGRRPRPTAVFCYNDLTAIGAMRSARIAGLRVPEDVSIMGYDDIAFASYVMPPLTTIRQRRYEMGYQATEIALALLAGEETVANSLVQGELVVRESCALCSIDRGIAGLASRVE